MKLYKILVVNMLTWGIPAVPAYYTYKLSQPFVLTGENLFGQIIGVAGIFVLFLVMNYSIFWEKYYHDYLTKDEVKPSKKIKLNDKGKIEEIDEKPFI